MGQVFHGSATTTEAVRRAIQAREESVRVLARRYGISPTTVQKGRKRTTVADARMGPKQIRSTVLSVEEEAVVVAFRRHTLLPLDDCLYALQPVPDLIRDPAPHPIKPPPLPAAPWDRSAARHRRRQAQALPRSRPTRSATFVASRRPSGHI